MTGEAERQGWYVRLKVWIRTASNGESWTVFKRPDGTEYRGDVYGLDRREPESRDEGLDCG